MIELFPMPFITLYCDMIKKAFGVDDKVMCSIIKEHLDELGRMVDEGKISGRVAALLLLCSYISCIRCGERLEADKGS